jgi:hypothetical protein
VANKKRRGGGRVNGRRDARYKEDVGDKLRYMRSDQIT